MCIFIRHGGIFLVVSLSGFDFKGILRSKKFGNVLSPAFEKLCEELAFFT